MESRHNLNRVSYFVAVVEEGTMTAAATRLEVSKAVVSKQLQRLEEDLGVGLLVRNTRRLRLTDAGQRFYEHGKAALAEAHAAFEAVADTDGVPSGVLRMTSPVDYGEVYVAPLVARYQQMYPRTSVELMLSDAQFDLIEHRYDLSFRVGWLEDSTNRSRKLRGFTEVVVCRPEFAEALRVRDPRDLAALPFVANAALGNANRWTFKKGRASRRVELRAAISMNVTSAVRQALRSASCFAIQPDFLVSPEIERGALVQLLPDWSLRSGGVYAVVPPGRARSRTVEAFLQMAYEIHA